ncbi:MAG: tetratricopeptide repeat protein [Vicinamibacterales bacterium]
MTDELVDKAWRARREGRLDEAERGLSAVVHARRREGNGPELVDALGKLAHVLRDLGRLDAALPVCEDAVTISRAGHNPLLLAHAVRHLGDLHREAGRLGDADRCYSEALALYRGSAVPDALDLANALRPAALLKEILGDRPLARQLFAEARDRYREAGIEAGVQECARHLAQLE